MRNRPSVLLTAPLVALAMLVYTSLGPAAPSPASAATTAQVRIPGPVGAAPRATRPPSHRGGHWRASHRGHRRDHARAARVLRLTIHRARAPRAHGKPKGPAA